MIENKRNEQEDKETSKLNEKKLSCRIADKIWITD